MKYQDCKIVGYPPFQAYPIANHYFENFSAEQKEQIKGLLGRIRLISRNSARSNNTITCIGNIVLFFGGT